MKKQIDSGLAGQIRKRLKQGKSFDWCIDRSKKLLREDPENFDYAILVMASLISRATSLFTVLLDAEYLKEANFSFKDRYEFWKNAQYLHDDKDVVRKSLYGAPRPSLPNILVFRDGNKRVKNNLTLIVGEINVVVNDLLKVFVKYANSDSETELSVLMNYLGWMFLICDLFASGVPIKIKRMGLSGAEIEYSANDQRKVFGKWEISLITKECFEKSIAYAELDPSQFCGLYFSISTLDSVRHIATESLSKASPVMQKMLKLFPDMPKVNYLNLNHLWADQVLNEDFVLTRMWNFNRLLYLADRCTSQFYGDPLFAFISVVILEDKIKSLASKNTSRDDDEFLLQKNADLILNGGKFLIKNPLIVPDLLQGVISYLNRFEFWHSERFSIMNDVFSVLDRRKYINNENDMVRFIDNTMSVKSVIENGKVSLMESGYLYSVKKLKYSEILTEERGFNIYKSVIMCSEEQKCFDFIVNYLDST